MLFIKNQMQTRKSCQIIFTRESISTHLISKISRIICCVERINDTFFQNFSKKLFKQNHDDLFAKHFKHKRTLNFLKKKYF